MSTFREELSAIKEVEDTLTSNKVANFAYTDRAYRENNANGVTVYDVNREQNIPYPTASILNVNETVLSKGWRSQASSITRMLLNHFLGRLSYNLNKVNDNMSNLLVALANYLGVANGIATLDASGRIPYSQLPESAIEYKGNWNANTNSPHLENGVGTKGDFYICNVAGTTNFGAGGIAFLVNDRAIYDGTIWSKLSAGDVRTVNNHAPDSATGNVNVNKTDVGLGNVVNTGDSSIPENGGNKKFTVDGAYNLLISFAPPFTASYTYSVDELTVYQNRLYICRRSHSGSWNANDFDPIGLKEFFQMYVFRSMADSFDSSETYSKGDFVTYNNRLYKCSVATHTGDWDGSHFNYATIESVIEGLEANKMVITDANGKLTTAETEGVIGVKGANEEQYRTGRVEISKSDIGLGSVQNTGDSSYPAKDGVTKFTTAGAYDFFHNEEINGWLGILFGWALGKRWKKSNAPNYAFRDIFYSEDKDTWVACSVSHGLYYAIKYRTINWRHVTTAGTATFNSVVCKGTRWFAGGEGTGLYKSSDGQHWSHVDGSFDSVTVYKIMADPYTNYRFFACTSVGILRGGYTGTEISWSVDENRSVRFTDIGFDRDNSDWVAVSRDDGIWYHYSTDFSWHKANAGADTIGHFFSSVFCGDGTWVAVCSDGGLFFASDDLSVWTKATGSIATVALNHVYYANGLWVAVGAGIWWSRDGRTWNSSFTTAIIFSHVTFGNGVWIACSTSIGVCWSEDGKDWVNAKGIGNISMTKALYCNKGGWAVAGTEGIYKSTYSEVDTIACGLPEASS